MQVAFSSPNHLPKDEPIRRKRSPDKLTKATIGDTNGLYRNYRNKESVKEEQKAKAGVAIIVKQEKMKYVMQENLINKRLMSIIIKEGRNCEEYTLKVGYGSNEDRRLSLADKDYENATKTETSESDENGDSEPGEDLNDYHPPPRKIVDTTKIADSELNKHDGTQREISHFGIANVSAETKV
ncbi:hypothetical protein ILUMI_20754, partial [Ignelater luminosus]